MAHGGGASGVGRFLRRVFTDVADSPYLEDVVVRPIRVGEVPDAGARVVCIRLHSDTSGLTVSSGRPSGPGMVVMLLAGYLAPPVVGLGAGALLIIGTAWVCSGCWSSCLL